MADKKKSTSDTYGCLLFLTLITIIGFNLIFIIGNQMGSLPPYRPLYAIYENQQYQHIFEAIDHGKYHYTHEDFDGDIVHFINAYAENRNCTVVNRHYNKSDIELAAISYAWSFSTFMNKLLKTRYNDNIWVLYMHGRKIPFYDIHDIQGTHPGDKIIIVSERNINVKGFNKLQIPDVNIVQELETVMKIPPSLGKAYQKEFSHSQLFQFIHQNSNSIQGHLGDYYVPIPEDSPKKVNKILKKICKKGVYKVGFLLKTYQSRLNDLGILIHDQKAYWIREEYRLNYILQKEKNCKEGANVPYKAYIQALKLQNQLVSRSSKQQKILLIEEEPKENECLCSNQKGEEIIQDKKEQEIIITEENIQVQENQSQSKPQPEQIQVQQTEEEEEVEIDEKQNSIPQEENEQESKLQNVIDADPQPSDIIEEKQNEEEKLQQNQNQDKIEQVENDNEETEKEEPTETENKEEEVKNDEDIENMEESDQDSGQSKGQVKIQDESSPQQVSPEGEEVREGDL